MASNQPTQAVIVVPNDDINIPEPGVYKSGTNLGGCKFISSSRNR